MYNIDVNVEQHDLGRILARNLKTMMPLHYPVAMAVVTICSKGLKFVLLINSLQLLPCTDQEGDRGSIHPVKKHKI